MENTPSGRRGVPRWRPRDAPVPSNSAFRFPLPRTESPGINSKRSCRAYERLLEQTGQGLSRRSLLFNCSLAVGVVGIPGMGVYFNSAGQVAFDPSLALRAPIILGTTLYVG